MSKHRAAKARRAHARLAAALVAATGAGLILGAVVVYDHRGYHTPSDAGIVPAATLSSLLTPISARSVPARTSAPLRVNIAGIEVTAPVVAVAVRHGALEVPDDVHTLGWWSHSARPGAAHGSVVLVGHVDSQAQGKGALFHLESVRMGSTVTITTKQGAVRYRVVGRRVYEKQVLPSSVFAQDGSPRLVLITCGGPFDAATRHYRDNVVVYAVPV